jgi:ubiquinol-cytochrome c reductase cytochrome c1 subunit
VCFPQRNASTQGSSESAGSWKNTALLSSSAALGFTSVAWYYYQFNRPTQAMTPAEEG